MAVDFTAIDFETANGFRGSACSVGLVRVRDGVEVAAEHWLMRPPEGFDRFDARNVQIHGIRAEDVADKPRFGEVYASLHDFVGDDVLVAHNAAFDVGVIRAGLQASGRAGHEYDYACTVKLARRTYNLASYSLPFASHAAGFELVSHHDALADARACAAIAVDAARRVGASDLGQAYRAAGLGLGRLEAFEPSEADEAALLDARRLVAGPPASRAGRGPWPTEGANPEPNVAADPSNPLFGETVVFTGELGMARPEAKRRAADVGARTADRVTRATTVLVVGDGFVAEDLATGRLTRKAKHVLALRETGRRVEVVSEGEFVQMVGGAWPAGV